MFCEQNTDTWQRYCKPLQRQTRPFFWQHLAMFEVLIYQNFALCWRGAEALTTRCTSILYPYWCWFLSLFLCSCPEKHPHVGCEDVQEPSSFSKRNSHQHQVRSDTWDFALLSLENLQGNSVTSLNDWLQCCTVPGAGAFRQRSHQYRCTAGKLFPCLPLCHCTLMLCTCNFVLCIS